MQRWRQLSLRHPYFMALALGCILPLAYAPVNLLPIFYLSFATVFYLAFVHRQSLKQLFLLGWLFGFGQFFTGLYWLGEAFLVDAETFLWLLPFAVTLLPAGLALFSGAAFILFGLSFRALNARFSRLPSLLWLALLWALAEYCRSVLLTGLPWNLPTMAWGSWLYLAQPANVVGVHGLGLLALISAAVLVSRQNWARVSGVVLLVASFAYSAVVLNREAPPMDGEAMQVLIVQPNLDQGEKWQLDKRQAHIDKIFKITRSGLAAAPQTRIIIWPETAIPALIDEGNWFGEALRRQLKSQSTYLLTGAQRRQLEGGRTEFYNSAMLWRGDGRLIQRGDKHHLVPFGEYLPMQAWLESIGLQQFTKLRGGYRAGPAAARFSQDDLPTLAPLICYEAIFPLLGAQHQRPAWLANLTNDGWFGKSLGPHQHLAHVRLRAIEQGLPLIRSANTGVSAAFDARGQLLAALPLGQAGTLSVTLPPPLPAGLYAQIGDAGFFTLWLLLMSLMAVLSRWHRIK